ncbi:MAG: glycosyl hydrolase family 25 [Bacteroidaceae bacterium]|nr:glycosyl hydrolase family 25 [Bacteroidaceae bacterium]
MNKTMRQLLILIFLTTATLYNMSAEPRDKKHATSMLPSPSMMFPDHLPKKAATDRAPEHIEFFALSIAPRPLYHATGREGLDVSHYQGNIDWKRVAQEGNVSYAYIKCSEGATIQDSHYQRNIVGAKEAGLPVGVYHFYRTTSSPADQLANMTSMARREHMDLVPIVDMEHRGKESIENFQQNLRIFVESVDRYYGKRPMLYTGQNFYNRYLVGLFPEHSWMIAKYIEEPPLLNDNLDYAIWQFSSKSRIPGINGHVDRSRLMEGHTLDEIAL